MTEIFEGYTLYVESLQRDISERQYDFYSSINTLRNYDVQLLYDPEESVMDFNRLYAEAQSFHSYGVTLLVDLHSEKAVWTSWSRKLKNLYKRVRRLLFANKPDIQTLRNQGLQEAAVEDAVPELMHLIDEVEESVAAIGAMIDTVQLKVNDFDKILQTLAKQQRVVESLVGIGYPVQPGSKINITVGSNS